MKQVEPLVSVCMVTYNHEDFLAEAIEGVLMQKTDFPIELVIGEDCSPDSTRKICEEYAQKYPEIIRLLPSEVNLGAFKNGFRTLLQCRGKYVAICDGDDYWTDPYLLRDHVKFLEKNPDYGLAYTDVEVVSPEGTIIDDPVHDEIRSLYDEGDVFFKLMQGNFINSCTVVFKQKFLSFDQDDPDKYWFTYDYWKWLLISMRSKVHFRNIKAACYRKHPGGITNTAAFQNSQKKNQYMLHDTIINFDRHYNKPISDSERALIFRKMISLLTRSHITLGMKLEIAGLIPTYFPGLQSLVHILKSKLKSMVPTIAWK